MAAEEAATLPDEWDPQASGLELFDDNALREAQSQIARKEEEILRLKEGLEQARIQARAYRNPEQGQDVLWPNQCEDLEQMHTRQLQHRDKVDKLQSALDET